MSLVQSESLVNQYSNNKNALFNYVLGNYSVEPIVIKQNQEIIILIHTKSKS